MTVRSTVLGVALFAVGGFAGFGFGTLARWAETSGETSTPDVGASDLWAQHAPLPVAAPAPEAEVTEPAPRSEESPLRPNVWTDFNPDIESPRIDPAAYVDPRASVIGDVEISRGVYVAPFVSVRGDEGQPLYVGEESNLQDGVVIHALETVSRGQPVPGHSYEVDGKRYAVYIGNRVSLAHQSHVHGPAYVEDDVFVGMQALVFKAHIGAGTVIEPDATVIGVHVAPGRYVPAGSSITNQATADRLPKITESYAFRDLNRAVVHVNTSLADGYSGKSLPAQPDDH